MKFFFESLLEKYSRLSPMGQARLIAAVIALVLVLGVLVLAMVSAGRYWRRVLRKPMKPAPLREDDWASKPLTPPDRAREESP